MRNAPSDCRMCREHSFRRFYADLSREYFLPFRCRLCQARSTYCPNYDLRRAYFSQERCLKNGSRREHSLREHYLTRCARRMHPLHRYCLKRDVLRVRSLRQHHLKRGARRIHPLHRYCLKSDVLRVCPGKHLLKRDSRQAHSLRGCRLLPAFSMRYRYAQNL